MKNYESVVINELKQSSMSPSIMELKRFMLDRMLHDNKASFGTNLLPYIDWLPDKRIFEIYSDVIDFEGEPFVMSFDQMEKLLLMDSSGEAGT